MTSFAQTPVPIKVQSPSTVRYTNPNIRKISISLAGDCSIGKLASYGYSGTVNEMYDKYGPGYFFQNVKPYFTSDDLTIVNFEGVLTESDKKVPKTFNIKGHPQYINVLTSSGVEGVSFANNHNYDYGDQSFSDTIAAFNSQNIKYSVDNDLGLFTTPDGFTIGWVSVDEITGHDHPKIEGLLKSGMDRLKSANVDVILTCIHWGIEREYYPNSYQKTLARMCIDWGADLIVGCHPHVLQGIDYYKGKYIIYSLGNFCFGANKNHKDKNSMIARAEFMINTTGAGAHAAGSPANVRSLAASSLQIVPVTISSVTSRNDYCPTPATGTKYGEIISKMNSYSSPFNVSIADDGKVVPQGAGQAGQ